MVLFDFPFQELSKKNALLDTELEEVAIAGGVRLGRTYRAPGGRKRCC